MQGVAQISGSPNPLIGEDTFYEVAEFYPDTPIKDYDQVKWKLFREEGGQWIELKGTLKQGRRVSFTFPQKWYGKQLLVEAFLFNPEKKAPPGLVIRPVMGPKKIRFIELKDVNGNELQEKPKYGQNITAKITTENMLGDTLRLSLWERDTYSDKGHDPEENQKLWNGTARVTAADGVVTKEITLSPAMMVEANKSWFEGGEHEYYMLVQADDTRSKYAPQTMAVQNEEVVLGSDTPQQPSTAQQEEPPTILEQIIVAVRNLFGLDEMPETGKTVTTVNQGDNETEENECPRCEVLTMDELDQIFTGASVEEKTQLMNAFNEANDKFGLDTCQQKAHFFAQILQEVGASINISNGESLNYAAEALPAHFTKFSETGRLNGPPNDLAYEYGRSERNNYTANEEMIANIAYANRGGNGDVDSGDGWKYRGRGIIQITFKNKYDKINSRIDSDYPDFGIDIDANNINELREGTIASMAYWKEYGCKAEADKGVARANLDAVVDIVNQNTPSRDARWGNLQDMLTVFKVNECEKNNEGT